MLSDIDIRHRLARKNIIIDAFSSSSIKGCNIAVTASCFAWLVPNKEHPTPTPIEPFLCSDSGCSVFGCYSERDCPESENCPGNKKECPGRKKCPEKGKCPGRGKCPRIKEYLTVKKSYFEESSTDEMNKMIQEMLNSERECMYRVCSKSSSGCEFLDKETDCQKKCTYSDNEKNEKMGEKCPHLPNENKKCKYFDEKKRCKYLDDKKICKYHDKNKKCEYFNKEEICTYFDQKEECEKFKKACLYPNRKCKYTKYLNGRFILRIEKGRTVAIVAKEAVYINTEITGSGKQIVDFNERGVSYHSSPIKPNSANRLIVYLKNELNRSVDITVGETVMLIELKKLMTPTKIEMSINTNYEALNDNGLLPSTFKNTDIKKHLECKKDTMEKKMEISPCFSCITSQYGNNEKVKQQGGIQTYKELEKISKRLEKLEEREVQIKQYSRKEKIFHFIKAVFFTTLVVVMVVVLIIEPALSDEQRTYFSNFLHTLHGKVIATLSTLLLATLASILARMLESILLPIISHIIPPKVKEFFWKRKNKDVINGGVEENDHEDK